MSDPGDFEDRATRTRDSLRLQHQSSARILGDLEELIKDVAAFNAVPCSQLPQVRLCSVRRTRWLRCRHAKSALKGIDNGSKHWPAESTNFVFLLCFIAGSE